MGQIVISGSHKTPVGFLRISFGGLQSNNLFNNVKSFRLIKY